MTTASDRLVQWMRDAHAMEEQAERILQAESSRIKNYPDLQARVEQHLQETRRQGERLKQRLDQIGGGTSWSKDAMANLLGIAQGMSGLFAGDEVMKGTLASYTFEHMEIASYKMLMAAAEEAGDMQSKQICEQNLREEEAMASWLEQHLAPVTRQFLLREETPGATAKR
jgi:ferritin-like metal-binding protein YciE